jgi:hypothetical protein
VPGWAGILVGLGSGAVLTLFSLHYGEWWRDVRARRKLGSELVAKARVLLDDAYPSSLTLASQREANRKHGRELWQRYRDLRLPLREFVKAHPSPTVRRVGEDAAFCLAVSIETFRAGADADDADARKRTRDNAKKWHDSASEAVDTLAEVLATARWRER